MIEESSPAAIYLDTSAVATAMFPGLAHSVASAALCATAAREGATAVYSQILWLELSQVLMKLPHGAALPAALRRRYRLNRWAANTDVRQGG